jgi:hypothetical protein
MLPRATFVPWTVLLLAALPAGAAEKVVLRVPGGRLLHAAEHGRLQAESFVPAVRETFEMVPLAEGQVAVKSPDGGWLAADARDGRTPRLDAAAEPGPRETFEIVPVASRSALRARISGELLALPPAAAGPQHKAATGGRAPAGPAPPPPVEIYRIRELPAILQTALPAVVRGLVAKELTGKEYDKTRKHKVEKFIDLPDPTLKDLTRMKRHQVIGLTEEYRLQAKLDGEADIRLPDMPLLTSCSKGGSGLMLFAVEASLPVEGHVQYQVPDAASASTGYHTTVWLAAVAEVPLERAGKDVTVGLPRLLGFRVSLVHLKLSNDLLEMAHRQIERFVNHELQQNDEKLREQANRAIKKALSSHEVRLPLLGYLGLLDNP